MVINMRAHKLDANGLIINTVVVNSLDGRPELVDASIGGQIGDSIINGVLVPAPVVVQVPRSVTRRQAKQALLLAGLLGSVQAAIDAIPDATQRGLVQIEWDDSQVFERDRPALINLASALGLTSEQLDALFITAADLA